MRAAIRSRLARSRAAAIFRRSFLNSFSARCGARTSSRVAAASRAATSLARPAGQISALKVVQTLDGEISRRTTFSRAVGRGRRGALRQQLAERDLATLAEAESSDAGGAMYYI